jgi:hypothetical protein
MNGTSYRPTKRPENRPDKPDPQDQVIAATSGLGNYVNSTAENYASVHSFTGSVADPHRTTVARGLWENTGWSGS